MSRLVFTLLLLSATPLLAQDRRARGQPDDAHRPPPGMCRIWIEGVPAARQPAPTDCATALRRRPPNARVIFGQEVRAPRRDQRPSPSLVPRGQQGGQQRGTPAPGRTAPRRDSSRPPVPPRRDSGHPLVPLGPRRGGNHPPTRAAPRRLQEPARGRPRGRPRGAPTPLPRHPHPRVP